MFPWRAAEHQSNSLSPLYKRTWTLFVPVPEGATGPIRIESRLRFRTHPPYLLRALGLDEDLDKIEIYDIDAHNIEVPLGGG